MMACHIFQDMFDVAVSMDWRALGIFLPAAFNAMPLEDMVPFNNLPIVQLLYKSNYKLRADQYFERYALSRNKVEIGVAVLNAIEYGSIDLV